MIGRKPYRAPLWMAMLGLAWLWLSSPTVASADTRGYVHIVRSGETLASIAQAYYGDPRRESVLVAENGLTTQGGAAIVVGMRLVIPWVSHHVVHDGETWSGIAEKYYGESRRAFALIDANQGRAGVQPDAGAELIVPYPLTHIAAQNETLRRVAETYYGRGGRREINELRRFNSLRSLRLSRGQVVLVPLPDLQLSDEGQRLIEERTGADVAGGHIRELQQRIENQLPELAEHVRRGRYTEAVSLGNRLLGAGELTGNQVVTIQRELGTAYVALGREDLAVEAFREALDRQPDLELDVTRTSPTVLAAFHEAKEQPRRPTAEGEAADAVAGGAAE